MPVITLRGGRPCGCSTGSRGTQLCPVSSVRRTPYTLPPQRKIKGNKIVNTLLYSIYMAPNTQVRGGMHGRRPNVGRGAVDVDSRRRSGGAPLARAHQGVIVVLLAGPIVLARPIIS